MRIEAACLIVAVLGCGPSRERGDTREREAAPVPVTEPAPAQPEPPTTLRWMLESETLDLSALAQAHAQLLARSLAIPGVEALDDCAPSSRVIIELDPTRLHAYALAPDDIIAALHDVSDTELETLRNRPIANATLGDLAGLRYGFADPECVAATAKGIAASATVRLADADAHAAMLAQLDAFARELPPDLSLAQLGPAPTIIEVSVADASTEQGAELLGRHLVGLPGRWLVEVGVASEPCAELGLRARLSIAELGVPLEQVLERLQRIPDVALVEQAGDPAVRRLWLSERDPQRAAALAEQLRSMPGVARADVAFGRPTLRVEPEPHAVAAYGLTTEQLMHQVQLLTDGIELGQVIAHGHDVPLLLRFGQLDAADPDQLRTAMIHAGERQVPLTELAQINLAASPDCRHDGRAGLALTVRVADAQQWPQLRPRIEAALPAGTWAWLP